MAKKVKFPLEMANGVFVRTIEELRENFDLEKAIGHYIDGKLLIWLDDHYYDEEKEQIEKLNIDNPNFKNQLCQILNVEYIEDNIIGIEEIEKRNIRIAKLKQYTADETIIANIDNVAFDQEELAILLDEKIDTIYLCQNTYRIPLRVKNKTYIGIGQAEAVISSKEKVDFKSLGIKFENIQFDENYSKINSEYTLEEVEKFSDEGNTRAKYMLGKIYYDGCKYLDRDTGKAYHLWEEGAEKGDSLCKMRLINGNKYDDEDARKNDYKEVKKKLKQMCDSGDVLAYQELGVCYLNETDEPIDYTKSLKLFHKAADNNYWNAFFSIALRYERGEGVERNYKTASDWHLKAAKLGYHRAQYELGYNLIYISKEDIPEGIKWIKKSLHKDSLIQNINKLINNFNNPPKYQLRPIDSWTYKYNVSIFDKFPTRGQAEDYALSKIEAFCEEANDTFNPVKNVSYQELIDNYISYFNFTYREYILVLLGAEKINSIDVMLDKKDEIIDAINSSLYCLSIDLNIGNFDIYDYNDFEVKQFYKGGGLFDKYEYYVESNNYNYLDRDLKNELESFSAYANKRMKVILENIAVKLRELKLEIERN